MGGPAISANDFIIVLIKHIHVRILLYKVHLQVVQNLPKYLIRSSFVAMNSRAISSTFRVSVSSL